MRSLLPVTQRLLQLRLRIAQHHWQVLDPGERLRAVLIAVVIISVACWGVSGLLDRLMPLRGTDEFPSLVRMEVYRMGAFLSALLSFSTFSLLWRAEDAEVLKPLPLEPRALLHFRLVQGGLFHFPLLLLAWLGFLPLFWQGEATLGLESMFALAVMYGGSLLSGMAWHMFAGASVGTEAYTAFKARMAGALVLPERTLLLYSPLLTAVSGFGAGLGVLMGVAAFKRGELPLGLLGVSLGLAVLPFAYTRARELFEHSYYTALCALAETEALGELGDARPEAEFIGQFYVERLPEPVRPLVTRDLRQAWRRARLDYLLLFTLAVAVALLSRSQGGAWKDDGLLFPLMGGILTLCGAQAFRLNRPESDAPWLWLSLPLPLTMQVQARAWAVGFFPVMVLPALVIVLISAGMPLLSSLLWLSGMSLASTLTAVILSLILFTKRRLAGTLYLALQLCAALLGRGNPWVSLLVLAVGAGLLFMRVRQLPELLLVDSPAR